MTRYNFRLYWRPVGYTRPQGKHLHIPQVNTSKPRFTKSQNLPTFSKGRPDHSGPVLPTVYDGMNTKLMSAAQWALRKAKPYVKKAIDKGAEKAKEFTLGKVVEHMSGSTPASLKKHPKEGFGKDIKMAAIGSITTSAYKSVLNKKKPADFFRDAQSLEFITNSGFRVVSGLQQQNPWDLTGTGANGGQLQNASAGIIWGGYGGGLSGVTIGAMNQLSNLSDDSTSTGKLHCGTCRLTTKITSMTETPVIVDIYELVAKHDLCANPSSTLASSLEVMSPWYAWDLGLDLTGFTTTQISMNNIGSLPYDSDVFNCYWKVCDKRRVTISAGSTHMHESEYVLNETLSEQRFQCSLLMQGITRSLLFVSQGTPVRDQTTNTHVGASNTVLNVTHEMRYTGWTVTASEKRTNYVPYQLTVAAGESVGPATGVITNDTPA
jgi:hypothetical protein